MLHSCLSNYFNSIVKEQLWNDLNTQHQKSNQNQLKCISIGSVGIRGILRKIKNIVQYFSLLPKLSVCSDFIDICLHT